MSDTATNASASTSVSRQQRLDVYEKRTSPFLSGLALVYLFTYSLQVIAYQPQEPWFQAAAVFGNVLWILFAADVLYRYALAPSKRLFVRRNILDILTVVVPQFRALRALRAFASEGILSKKRGALTGKAVAVAAMATVLVVWVGSLMVLSAERGAQGAEITTFGDALWWSFETITTVGYGDFVPVTAMGRFFAVFVMLVGISVLGVVSASLAATLVKQSPTPSAPHHNDDVLTELADLKAMVAALSRQLETVGSAGSGGVGNAADRT